MPVPNRHSPALPSSLVAALAVALLGMTLAWHIPLMLWDHLDLVPLLPAAGGSPLAWLDVHGGHWHAAAYPLLLATTALSGGQPWLDCVASWLLLLGFAALIDRIADSAGLDRRQRPWAWALLLVLALYPGHLPNLQWGWQVAVFLCLFGCAATLRLLTLAELRPWHNALALAAAVLALLSFASALALLPVAVLAIALRREASPARRWRLALPWLLLTALVAAHYLRNGLASDGAATAPLAIVGYVLNFIGAGIARFTPEAAPWLAAAALLAAVGPLRAALGDPQRRPWLLLVAFALTAAGATALGRAGPFGAEHAFVSRYVSISSLFWVGWAGLLASDPAHRRWPRRALVALALLALVNAVHLAKRSARIADEARATATQIREQWPHVPTDVLAGAYFDQPAIARQRFATLRELGYAPFAPRPAGEP